MLKAESIFIYFYECLWQWDLFDAFTSFSSVPHIHSLSDIPNRMIDGNVETDECFGSVSQYSTLPVSTSTMTNHPQPIDAFLRAHAPVKVTAFNVHTRMRGWQQPSFVNTPVTLAIEMCCVRYMHSEFESINMFHVSFKQYVHCLLLFSGDPETSASGVG
jgi:hypothetical protein